MNPDEIIGKKLEDVQDKLNHTGVKGLFSSTGIKDIFTKPFGDDFITNDELANSLDDADSYSTSSPDGTWEISLGLNNRIETIFMFLNKGHPDVFGVTKGHKRKDIISIFSEPFKQSDDYDSDVFGKCGGWEKYEKDNYFIHIEHEPDDAGIKVVSISVKDPSK